MYPYLTILDTLRNTSGVLMYLLCTNAQPYDSTRRLEYCLGTTESWAYVSVSAYVSTLRACYAHYAYYHITVTHITRTMHITRICLR